VSENQKKRPSSCELIAEKHGYKQPSRGYHTIHGLLTSPSVPMAQTKLVFREPRWRGRTHRGRRRRDRHRRPAVECLSDFLYLNTFEARTTGTSACQKRSTTCPLQAPEL